jgi:hypothetical protein
MDSREPETDPRRWAVSGDWANEPQETALARIPAFGRRFFAEVFAEFPALAAGVRFLRWSEQPEDVYAVFEQSGGEFGVQVDPHLEILVVWGPEGQAEHGSWDDDPVMSALGHVRRLVASREASPDLV